MTVELVKIYQSEIGNVMDEKIQLLKEENSDVFMIQNVSDDPNSYFILILNGEISYGYWCVDEPEIAKYNLSFSSLFSRLQSVEQTPANLENLIKKSV